MTSASDYLTRIAARMAPASERVLPDTPRADAGTEDVDDPFENTGETPADSLASIASPPSEPAARRTEVEPPTPVRALPDRTTIEPPPSSGVRRDTKRGDTPDPESPRQDPATLIPSEPSRIPWQRAAEETDQREAPSAPTPSSVLPEIASPPPMTVINLIARERGRGDELVDPLSSEVGPLASGIEREDVERDDMPTIAPIVIERSERLVLRETEIAIEPVERGEREVVAQPRDDGERVAPLSPPVHDEAEPPGRPATSHVTIGRINVEIVPPAAPARPQPHRVAPRAPEPPRAPSAPRSMLRFGLGQL
jgi:hypothetical protein